MINTNIISFLTNRNWTIARTTEQFTELSAPVEFSLPEDFRVYVPRNLDRIDTDNFIQNIFDIIGDFYSLTHQDLIVLLKKENAVLKIRVHDNDTADGKISLTRFEELVEKIRSILSDTASFVIDKSVTSTRVPEEVARYLNLCHFMQTERGSFVAKVQLPSKELIKDQELFDRHEIYSREINAKLSEVLQFVNDEILEGNAEVTEEYLHENESLLHIKLLKDIEAFFDKADLKNIDFVFHDIASSNSIKNENITRQKLHKLTTFVEQIEGLSYEVGEFTLQGRIVTLKSKDPDGLKNSVTYSGMHENMPIIVTANLDSEYYKEAIEAHKLKQSIAITGKAKKTKTRARFIEVTNFQVID